ncbi:MAG: CapA family protein [Pyrinomonadaceae bacterium]
MFSQNIQIIILSTVCVTSLLLNACEKSQTALAEENQTVQNTKKPQTRSAPANNEPIMIAAVGDIMLGSTFPNETRMPPNDGEDSLKAVAPLLSAADIAFGNLEGPMLEGGESEKCGEPKPGQPIRCFAFRVPVRYGKYLKAAGFDVLSLANNHAGDFGDAGRSSTRKILDELGIKHAGSDRVQFSTAILEARGKKIAFVGFAHNNIVPNVNDLETARRLVSEAKKKADIVVVSFHGGAEGTANTHVPNNTEMFFGEARGNLRQFARTVIDAGADLVLGHGPHVLRGMEIYKDRLVVYSLGNFATYGWFQLAGGTAESEVLELKIAADGKFISGKINPVALSGRGIPVLDKTNSAIATIRNLSIADFGVNAPKIKDDGTF